jgi:hypothetical protein
METVVDDLYLGQRPFHVSLYKAFEDVLFSVSGSLLLVSRTKETRGILPRDCGLIRNISENKTHEISLSAKVIALPKFFLLIMRYRYVKIHEN